VSQGTVYLMPEYSEVGDVLAQEDWLVLIDNDSDGTLDSWLTLTEQEWNDGGWGDPSSYISD